MMIAAFLLYDFLLTFDKEIQLFWRKPLSAASMLFYLNRYLTLTVYILVAIGMAPMALRVSLSSQRTLRSSAHLVAEVRSALMERCKSLYVTDIHTQLCYFLQGSDDDGVLAGGSASLCVTHDIQAYNTTHSPCARDSIFVPARLRDWQSEHSLGNGCLPPRDGSIRVQYGGSRSVSLERGYVL